MFLPNVEIKRLASLQDPLITQDTFNPDLVRQASYDLRLGGEYFLIGDDYPGHLDENSSFLILRPGQFAFLTSFEVLAIPFNILGFITLKSSYKNQGLINISGFHVDPTFKGRLRFAVQNIGPSDLRLRYKEDTFTMFFARVDAASTSDIGEGRAAMPDEGIPLSLIQHLGGSTITLAQLQKDLDEVKTRLLIYAPLAVAALVPLVLLLINLLRGSSVSKP